MISSDPMQKAMRASPELNCAMATRVLSLPMLNAEDTVFAKSVDCRNWVELTLPLPSSRKARSTGTLQSAEQVRGGGQQVRGDTTEEGRLTGREAQRVPSHSPRQKATGVGTHLQG